MDRRVAEKTGSGPAPFGVLISPTIFLSAIRDYVYRVGGFRRGERKLAVTRDATRDRLTGDNHVTRLSASRRIGERNLFLVHQCVNESAAVRRNRDAYWSFPRWYVCDRLLFRGVDYRDRSRFTVRNV